jgi:5'-nucleotidase
LRILVTNDDGIHSDGLWQLAEALSAVGEISIVAPDRDQSGVAASLTLTSVLRVQEVPSRLDGVVANAVQGTPGDCVILAIETILDEPPDLVVSGVNRGANLGHDVLISGTVGAAAHGYMKGFTSIAVSARYGEGDARYEVAARAAAAVARALKEAPLDVPHLINLNVPDLDAEEIKGVELTRPGPRAFVERVTKARDGTRTHYWIAEDRILDIAPAGTDLGAMRDGSISISSLDFGFSEGEQAAPLDYLVDAVRADLGIHSNSYSNS